MILHVIPDNVYLDSVIPRLLDASAAQKFVILSENKNEGTLFPLHYGRDAVDFVLPQKMKSYCAALAECDDGNLFVVFHCLTQRNYSVIKLLYGSYPLGWIPWGGCDLYDYLPLDGCFLRTFISVFISSCVHKKISMILHIFRHGILYRIFPLLDPAVRVRRCFSWCFPLISEDYEIYHKRVGEKYFTRQYFEVSYWCYEKSCLPSVVHELDSIPEKHANVMVGNMGGARYNHLEVFSLLKGCPEILDRKIYVSLGYGDQKYSSRVMKMGHRNFGDALVPLTSFMPKEEYFKLISTCGIYVTNNITQEGLGTMQLALMAGCKLYLNSNSPTYRFMRRIGLIVFALPKTCDSEFLKQLSLEQKRHNQDICLSYWGRENVLARWKKMIEICNGGY